MSDLSNPITRIENYLAGIAGVLGAIPNQPITRVEEYLEAIYNSVSGIGEKMAENLADEYDATATYSADDYVTYDGVLYKALADSADPAGEWVAEDWESAQVIPEVANLSEWEALPDEDIDWKTIDVPTIYRWGKLFINKERTLINFQFVYIIGAKPSSGSKHIASLHISDYVSNLKTNAVAYDSIRCYYSKDVVSVNTNNKFTSISSLDATVNDYGNLSVKISAGSFPNTMASMSWVGNVMLPAILLQNYTPEG